MNPTLPFPDIKDIVAPVEPAAAHAMAWGWWAGAAVLGLAVAGLLVWWGLVLRRRMLLPGLPGNPDKTALRELEELRKKAAGLTPGDFAAELSGIVRAFVQRRTGLLAHVSTSPEILGDRRRPHHPPPPPLVAAFRKILTDSDAVKYGSPAPPSAERLHALIDDAVAAVKLASAPLPASAAAAAKPVPPPLPTAPSPPADASPA